MTDRRTDRLCESSVLHYVAQPNNDLISTNIHSAHMSVTGQVFVAFYIAVISLFIAKCIL